jgi:hypothetical protein
MPVFASYQGGVGQAQHPARTSKTIENNIPRMKGFPFVSFLYSAESLNSELTTANYPEYST